MIRTITAWIQRTMAGNTNLCDWCRANGPTTTIHHYHYCSTTCQEAHAEDQTDSLM